MLDSGAVGAGLSPEVVAVLELFEAVVVFDGLGSNAGGVVGSGSSDVVAVAVLVVAVGVLVALVEVLVVLLPVLVGPPVALAIEPGLLALGALDSAAVVLAVTLFCTGAGDGVASSAQATGMLKSGRSRRRVRRGWRMLGEALGAQMMPPPP